MANVKKPVTIDGIEFDALISEDRTLEASVPEYAVESGYSISDSVILSPMKLSMTLFVTNTPVTWLKRHGHSATRVKDVCKRLEQIYFNAEPVTVITTDGVYTNMAIESIAFSKNAETGPSREIPISFKKIQVTKATTTYIPASYGKSGSSSASAGTASTSSGSSSATANSTDGTESKSSILYSIGSSLGLIK